jgi:hypothetical protein
VVSPRDGRTRISVEKVGAYPVYVIVGLASDDFLAPWYKEVRNASIFLVVLMGCRRAAAGRALRPQKQYQILRRWGGRPPCRIRWRG